MFESRGRTDAGRRLGQRPAGLRGQDVVVPGLPRGGFPAAVVSAVAEQPSRQGTHAWKLLP